MMDSVSLLSVVVPCRNEKAHIEDFCRSVAAQQLPPGVALQVLIADGRSDDGTRELIDAWCAADSRFTRVDNPRRIVSTGLNRCIALARGEVVARLDIHSRYAPDYLAMCLQALQATGADNVGGPWVAHGEGAMGQAIAAAFQSRWVVGGARSRDLAYEGEVDSVYLGCWPRGTLERVGGFDETLVRNQDDEHNLRLRLAGGRVWQSPHVRSWYRPRGSVGQLFAQQMQYGYWRLFVLRKHSQPGSVRQLIPAVFVAALAVSLGVAPWLPALLIGLLGAYAAYLVAVSVQAARQASRAGQGDFVALLWRLPAVVAAYHLGYGLGGWRALFDMLWRRAAGSAFTRLTR